MTASRSDALVLFGVTGDLAHKLIFPALYAMVKSNELKVPIIGVAFPKWSLHRLHNRVTDSIQRSGGIDDKRALQRLLSLFRYVSGDYKDPATFAALKKALGSARRPAHYLAIPPSLFESVIKELGAANLAENARVIVEKPFGRDLASARELNCVARSVFPEDSVFRIDHFLGKEAIMLGRLTQEMNPENGTTTYIYDSDTICTGGYPAGNVVKKTDSVGNVTCYQYDQLHRLLNTTYPAGSYSTNTDKRFFVYDAATVAGVAMLNPKGRLAEAYTCPATGACTTKKTDLGFSYSARGEIATVYEKTPNSGATYYQVSASYWAHGGIKALSSNLSGLPTITYGASDGSGVDGEGRVTKVTTSSTQNPTLVSAVNYTNSGTMQPIGSLTQVTFGSSDFDTFSYDPNTGRLNQYKFSVGATPQTVTSNLTWNPNGSLASLSITDQLNSANTQTCNYSHDDLGRVATANCGTLWSQAFGFDPFGNVSKTATAGISFLPTYSQSTNRYSSVPGCTPSYDANGFATNDCAHTYSWDAAGNPLAIDAVSLTYDALGRMVEQGRGAAYSQVVYAPGGAKLALTNGQNLTKAFVPLLGGATAVYTSTGLIYCRHSDWLGSSRLATTPARTLYFDTSYGPYGESYASSGSADLNFTGQNQDTVSGLYDFLFREYNANQGRWPSPDPAGIDAASMGNPQTWNRYSYVANAPLSSVDHLGLMSDAVQYLRGMARTAAFYSAFEFFTFSTLDKTWNQPELISTSAVATIDGDPESGSMGASSLSLLGGGWSFQVNTTMVGLLGTSFSLTANNYKPWEMRSNVVELLRTKNDCSDWFNTGTGSAADIMSTVPIKLGNPRPGPLSGSDADTGLSPNSPITVYADGRFYTNSKSGILVGGSYAPGDYGARMIILLHELAHKMGGLIKPDGLADGMPLDQSEKNSSTVMSHCAATIDAHR